MATVAHIKQISKGRVIIGVTEGEDTYTLNIPATLYASASFVRGSLISDAELDTLRRADEEYRAMKKALSLLGYSDKNRRALYMRLVREGFSRDVVNTVVERCLSLGYIKEREQIERLVLYEANTNLRGPRYICDKLAAKGYSRTDVDEVIDSLVSLGEIDFSENFDRLCRKRGADTDVERRALAYKYGFRAE